MKIYFRKEVYRFDNGHPFVPAILELARNSLSRAKGRAVVPERNDIKRLWLELGKGHRELLYQIARHPLGTSQDELQKALAVDWQGLRGVHNGLARICERLGCEKPIRVVGYNSDNRRYLMDPDVATTVTTLYTGP